MAHRLDIRDFDALKALAGEVEQGFGAVDILACVAGIQAFKPLLEMQDAD